MSAHKKRLPMRLSQQHERWIYATGGVLFLSGLGWLIAHFFLAGPGEFGELHHVSEPWWLRLHGAGAMVFLLALGSLFPGHIVRAWQVRKNHRTGLLMLTIMAVLVVTGYGLYYAGDETTRPWISAVHWVVGLAAAAGLLLHVQIGRRSRGKRPIALEHPIQSNAPDSALLLARDRQRASQRRI